jgi:hypothetical protein
MPAYSAVSKHDLFQTQNIETKCPSLVQTMNMYEFIYNTNAVSNER